MIKMITLIVLTSLLFVDSSVATNGVRLDDIKTLTLYSDRMTEAGRGKAIPQMSCVGGDACSYQKYRPKTTQCYNMGSDGEEAQWSCEADLHPHVRFGELVVNCEGYLSPTDENVLSGSCGLEYNLEFTGEGLGRSYMGGLLMILFIAASPFLCAMGGSGRSTSGYHGRSRVGRRYISKTSRSARGYGGTRRR